MKKIFFAVLLPGMVMQFTIAQTSNVGIGTPTPGSVLSVEGSLGLAYKAVTTNYAMTASDYYVVWSAGATGTVTLPAAMSGSGNYKGRVYTIRNASSGFNLTIAANGTERIDQTGGSGVASISINVGQILTLISTGLTTGKTWEVVSLTNSTGPNISWLFTGGNTILNVSGNVGIGTFNPPGTKLEVLGTTRTSRLEAPISTATGGLTVGIARIITPETFLILDETHYCIVVAAVNCIASFPDPTTCAGRIYVLINTSAGLFYTNLNTPNDEIEANTQVHMISDGVSWLQLN